MGAKQSKRSVDITNTPTKGEAEAIGEGEGRVVKLGDVDLKATTNGAVPHTDIEVGEKDENAKDLTVEKENKEEEKEVKENGVSESEDAKTPDSDSVGDNLNETEKSPENTENKIEETADTKKQKEKKKKKWSFRSISFSKKDKSKSGKESDKNGEVKEVAEENVEESATSPTAESPKTEKPESTEPAPVLNGEASKDEIVNETPKSDDSAPVEEPKKEEPAAAEPAKEEAPQAEPVVETKAEEPKAEEPKPAEVESPKVPEPVVESASSPKEQVEPSLINPPSEETKEVRNEELPPPLPSSNPPSSVTVFAESTKADILTTAQIDLLQAVPAEPTNEIAKSEIELAQSPAQKLSETVPEIEISKQSESEIKPIETSSKTEVAKTPEPEPEPVSSENLVIEAPTKAANEPESEKSITDLEISKTEINVQPVTESPLVEIKGASESLTSIPDSHTSEPEVQNIESKDSDLEVTEIHAAKVESENKLKPQISETNLLINEPSKKSIIDSQESEILVMELADPIVGSDKSNIESVPNTSDTHVVSEEKLEPLVDLDLIPKIASPEIPPQKSEPELKSETTSSTISGISSNESNKTEPIEESLSSIPPPILDVSSPTQLTEHTNYAVENKLPETKPADVASEEYKDCLQPSVASGDSLKSAKSEDVVEGENKTEASSTDLQSSELSSAENNVPSELSLVYSEESSATLPAPESMPELPAAPEEPKSLSKVEDSEPKSVSEEFPVDLPSPSDLPPPSSGILDRLGDPADSLQDISTESLPSLPEPISENLAEPMSLPPVDSVPEPIATDCVSPSESVPLPPPVLTNGNTNGLHSPSEEDALTLKEGPLKQVPPTEIPSEVVKDEKEEKAAPAEVAAVEE